MGLISQMRLLVLALALALASIHGQYTHHDRISDDPTDGVHDINNLEHDTGAFYGHRGEESVPFAVYKHLHEAQKALAPIPGQLRKMRGSSKKAGKAIAKAGEKVSGLQGAMDKAYAVFDKGMKKMHKKGGSKKHTKKKVWDSFHKAKRKTRSWQAIMLDKKEFSLDNDATKVAAHRTKKVMDDFPALTKAIDSKRAPIYR